MVDAAMPTVAIVGRPNVGKSTLLNRIVGRRAAIVEEKPGVTRDRKVVEADWLGRRFLVVDTGGWIVGGDTLDAKVSAQSERAMSDADVILFVVDAVIGRTEDDDQVAARLRRVAGDRPVLVVVNKIDDAGREANAWDFLGLGFGEPIALSALHGRGAGDLLDAVVARLPLEGDLAVTEDDQDDDAFSIAIVGRPNVGKSTLFNRLIGEERAVVHDRPGTTRDTIDTIVDTEDGPLRFIDTAGMRRKAKIDEGTEYYSLVRALQAVDGADIALLVIDATVGVTAQDQRLAERVDAAGCPVVVLLNKWDAIDTDQREAVAYQLGRKLHFLGEAPVLRISALTGKGVQRLLPALQHSIDAYRVRVPTARVNQVVRSAQQAQPAPHGARVLYAAQVATDPPTFTLFANRELPPTYLRYLERKLREAFDIGPTPIKLRVRRRTS
jgi:GTP-binding protein